MPERKGFYRNRRGKPAQLVQVGGRYVEKTIPNPDWLNSEEYREEERKKSALRGECVEDRFPDDYGKQLPDEGGWIMLLMDVKVGRQIDNERTEHIHVPRLSIWYAMPQRERHGLYQAIISTPQGAVHVWPHEYNVTDIAKWLEFSEKDGLQTHFLSTSGGFDEYALFYLRSRGIPKGQAQRMLLATLKDPNYCYFTFVPEVVACFSESAGVLYLQAVNHERRAASRRKRLA